MMTATSRAPAGTEALRSLVHEVRNPLNVIKTSVYYLMNAQAPSREKLAEHLGRIERQVQALEAATIALRGGNIAAAPAEPSPRLSSSCRT